MNLDLSEPAGAWLVANVDGYHCPGRLEKFSFGQSNPTYKLSCPGGRFVLRRKPSGQLLPKAHAIEREFRVLKALGGSPIPIPHVHAYCADAELVGAPFYVMDFVDGRIFYDQRLPGMTAGERADIFDAMNAAIADLHAVAPAALGLGDYGRPEGFMERQVAIWTNQYRASAGDHIKAMERLVEWLPEHLPASQEGRIFHGDLRLDNMMFHPTESRVIALLDWELSTLGDPIADFAYHAMAWRVPADLFRGFADLDRTAIGIPEESDYVQRYCRRTGRTELPDWNYYLAFGFFRVAAILQGVWKRAQTGNASSIEAEQVGARAAPLAEIGWSIAQHC